MKYIVCGFYHHSNLGDDAFVSSLARIFEGDTLEFTEVAEIDRVDFSAYDRIIVGAGDLMNDFYGAKYAQVLAACPKYKIAVGVGISFEECLSRPWIRLFDDVILRSERDVPALAAVLGSRHVHYMPDVTYVLPVARKDPAPLTVGVFLVGSLMKHKSFFFCILSTINWLLSEGYRIRLFSMFTDPKIDDNDIAINASVCETFAHTGRIEVIEHSSVEDFRDKMSDLHLALCFRFHAHIFCSQFGIPFLSFPFTRKVQMLNEDLQNEYAATIRYDPRTYQPISYDCDQVKDLFIRLANDKQASDRLAYRSEKWAALFRTGKVANIVRRGSKRLGVGSDYVDVDPEKIYQTHHNSLLSRGINYRIDSLKPLLNPEEIGQLAEDICYDCTLDPSNKYVFGTKINLESKLSALRDMIFWICQNERDTRYRPKFNLEYMKQDSFRGLHRSGWQFAIDSLTPLSGRCGALLDTYCDRTFGWASGVLQRSGVLPYTTSWVGFLHHTFNEEYSDNNLARLFASSLFQASLPFCRGFFVMSRYLRDQVLERLSGLGYDKIPVCAVYHPMGFDGKRWDPANWSRQCVNVGAWYRDCVSIYVVAGLAATESAVTYHALKGKEMDSNFPPSDPKLLASDHNTWTRYYKKYLKRSGAAPSEDFVKTVSVIGTLDNEEYDTLLSSCVMFLDLVDASCANSLIEAIVRKTPVCVNRIAPVVEALGEDYPLYYDSLEEVPSLLTDEKVLAAHEYLCRMNDDCYRIENFVAQITSSEIYKNL